VASRDGPDCEEKRDPHENDRPEGTNLEFDPHARLEKRTFVARSFSSKSVQCLAYSAFLGSNADMRTVTIFVATALVSLLLPLSLSTAAEDRGAGSIASSGPAIDELEKLYQTGRDGELHTAVQSELDKEYFEVPNYKPYFYVAYLDFKKNDLRSATRGLAQFKCMLKVDSGARSCSGADFDHNSLCFQTMCAEMYLDYYSHPSRAARVYVARYWNHVHELEARIRKSRSTRRSR
jgi:hypothetical protein